ncbi:hypothetical protein AB0I28_28195 [Phytomonospora sp. NPDC050363]|uniref:hypothetical protein n=1 Tax=Phytomonospora sp. NPDC050363 TaxID=3155642 RepID=UPI0033CB6A81
MSETAVAALGPAGGLVSEEGLTPGLRAMVAEGIEVRGDVVVWNGGARWAEAPPGRSGTLTGWECFVNYFHLDDEVPVAFSEGSEPSIAEDEQVVLLRQGAAFGVAVCRLAMELDPPVPLRCVVVVGVTSGTFRFHRIRRGEDWVRSDPDTYREEKAVVIEAWRGGF